MGLFKRLFGEKEIPLEEPVQDRWKNIPPYIEEREYQLASLVASAIAASDSNSDFVVKRVRKRNPEAQLVSIIATIVATGEQPESVFRVTSIKEEKLGGSNDVA